MGELENPSKFKKNRLLWDMRAHEFVSGFFLGGDSENHDILTEDGKQIQFIHPRLHLGGDTLPRGIKSLIPVLFLAYFLEPASQTNMCSVRISKGNRHGRKLIIVYTG